MLNINDLELCVGVILLSSNSLNRQNLEEYILESKQRLQKSLCVLQAASSVYLFNMATQRV